MAETGKKSGRKSRQTKDRVLQARIPRQLDDELREQAEQLGLSVSTVVRNVLLNTFELVEGVVADSAQLARVIQGRQHRPHRHSARDRDISERESGVVAWQEAVLNRNGICEHCNAILQKGERAAIGIPTGAKAEMLCLPCLANMTASHGQNPATNLAPGE